MGLILTAVLDRFPGSWSTDAASYLHGVEKPPITIPAADLAGLSTALESLASAGPHLVPVADLATAAVAAGVGQLASGSLSELRGLMSAMGPALIVSVMIFVVGVVSRLRLPVAVRSALQVGVSFVGIFALLAYVLAQIGKTVQSMADVWGLNLVGIDIGWAAVAGFTWTLGVTVLVIPLVFGANLVMLAAGRTKTLNADIWNYWQFAFNAAVVYLLTDSWALGLGAGLVTGVVVIKLADWTADLSQAYFGVPGTSLPNVQSMAQAPFAFALDRLIRKVPVVGELDASPDAIERRIGPLGDPVVLGFLVGGFLGVLAVQPPLEVFRTAVYVAALLALMPRIVESLVEGIEPIVEQASAKIEANERFSGQGIVIGIDGGPIAFSDTTSVVAGLLLVPYALGLAFIPGVTVVPLADLVLIPIFCMFAAAISRGNLVRTVISGGVMTTVITATTTLLAPYVTAMGEQTGELAAVDTGGASVVSSLSVGANWWTLGAFAPLGLPGEPGMAVAAGGVVTALLAAACYWWTRDMPDRVAAEIEAESGGTQAGTGTETRSEAGAEPVD
ncbi:MAG: PTS transporter subunit IIC [Haloarculaceae archaeon]